MRNKFIPLAVALVFGSVAVVGFSQMMKAGPTIQTVEIYVANRTINPAEEIAQDAIQLEQWPADRIPEDAIRDWKQLEGKFAAQRLFAGEPVLQRKLMNTNDTRAVDIPRGYNVVALKSDEVSSVANLVAPGDRVNVIGFFTKSEVIPETTTRTVLSGVRVFAVDGRTSREKSADDDKNMSAKTVALLIHNGDAEVLAWARELARISLTLGRPDEGGTNLDDEGPNPAGIAFMQWLTDHKVQEATLPPSPNVQEVSAPAPAPAAPEEPEISHRMVKIGEDGKLSVYTWEVGNPIPKITTEETAAQKQENKEETGNLEYLNGEDSPLFSDPDAKNESEVDELNEDEIAL